MNVPVLKRESISNRGHSFDVQRIESMQNCRIACFCFRMLQKDSETFFKASRPEEKNQNKPKTFFVYVSKRIVLYIDDILDYQAYGKSQNICLQVERDITNDFMCRCRYCTMVCKKEKKKI